MKKREEKTHACKHHEPPLFLFDLRARRKFFFLSQPFSPREELPLFTRATTTLVSLRTHHHTQRTQCSLSRPTLVRRNHKRLHSGSIRREKRDFIRASSEYPVLHTRRGRKDLVGTDSYEKKRKKHALPTRHHALSELYTWAQKKTTNPRWWSRIR